MVIIARHGQTEWNVEGRLQGHGNSPLTDIGEIQAHTLGKTLSQEGYSYGEIHASPLGRASDTAKIISEILSMEVGYDTNLMEMSFGNHEGKSKQERNMGVLKLQLQEREKDKFHYRLPGGENYADILKRAQEFIKQKDPNGGDIIVAHEAMNRMLIKALCNLSVEDSMSISQPNDVIYRVLPDGSITHRQIGEGNSWQDGLLQR